MPPVSAWRTCYLFCLFAILCGTTTRIRSNTAIHAHPIQKPSPPPRHINNHALQPRQELATDNAFTIASVVATSTLSSSPSSTLDLTAPTPSSTTAAIIQRPLIEIISPNVTLFAALDLPVPGSSESVAAVIGKSNGSAPLLLPTSSLAILQSQIYHVNDSTVTGAGGSEPLTGIVFDWTIGCDLNDDFPTYPPTEKPWIAFVSSSLLSSVPQLNNITATTTNDVNDEIEGSDQCDVSTLIAIIQAISTDVVGVIMYQDPESKVSFLELKQQTEKAILDLHYLDQSATSGTNYNPASKRSFRKRAISGFSKEEIMRKVAARKQYLREQLTSTKLATPGQSPYSSTNMTTAPAGTTPSSPSADIPSSGDPPASSQAPVTAPSSSSGKGIGVMAMGDPALIQILRKNTGSKTNVVIAQMTFANNALGPHPSSKPGLPNRPSSTNSTGRPAADRSLGLFFWIILAAVVLIIGIWVGFGIVETRSLARRRREIALEKIRRRTVDQKVLDTYKTKIFQEGDIMYSDDEDEDGSGGQGVSASGAGGKTQRDNEIHTRDGDDRSSLGSRDVSNEKDGYYFAESGTQSRRVFARADLAALRHSTANRNTHRDSINNSLGMGRRSFSFDETVYGGLESSWSRRPSGQETLCMEPRRPSLKAAAALNRDTRCHSWTESKPKLYDDYGGEDESVCSYDQEKGYTSHAQEGWTNLQIDRIQSLDGDNQKDLEPPLMPWVPESNRRGSAPSVNVTPAPTPSKEDFTDFPAFPAPVRRGSAGVADMGGLHHQPTLRHKSRFILPRKIETDMPQDMFKEDITSPTLFSDGASSAGPSTAGFLPPIGWGGERRRSSQTTVAVPDNGKGIAQANWAGPHGQRLRRTSLQVHRLAGTPISRTSFEEEQYASRSSSEMDDGRGVGQGEMSRPTRRELVRGTTNVDKTSYENQSADLTESAAANTSTGRRAKKGLKEGEEVQEVTNSSLEEYKMRFSMIGVELPDIYSPTTGEFSRLFLDADSLMIQIAENAGSGQIEELRDVEGDIGASSNMTDSSCIHSGDRKRQLNPRSQHNKDLTTATTDTMATAITSSSPIGARIVDAAKKQRKRRYDPCAICLEEYEVGDKLRELPCKHFFHSHCIDPWFKDVHSVCPVCKRDYSEEGRISASALREQEAADRRNVRSSGISAFLSPLAVFAGGAQGAHYWYAADTGF
ncbi:hypothetical protein BGZ50_006707 [Haplosporangium sp. Z 11]|nr:hypothetical protein BGZ50_006707 [Haplosporangium sp. Z 11]